MDHPSAETKPAASSARHVVAGRGTGLRCKGWRQEVILRMLAAPNHFPGSEVARHGRVPEGARNHSETKVWSELVRHNNIKVD
jgi:hypothetical protein